MVTIIQTSLKTPREEKSLGREVFFFFLNNLIKRFSKPGLRFRRGGHQGSYGAF